MNRTATTIGISTWSSAMLACLAVVALLGMLGRPVAAAAAGADAPTAAALSAPSAAPAAATATLFSCLNHDADRWTGDTNYDFAYPIVDRQTNFTLRIGLTPACAKAVAAGLRAGAVDLLPALKLGLDRELHRLPGPFRWVTATYVAASIYATRGALAADILDSIGRDGVRITVKLAPPGAPYATPR